MAAPVVALLFLIVWKIRTSRRAAAALKVAQDAAGYAYKDEAYRNDRTVGGKVLIVVLMLILFVGL